MVSSMFILKTDTTKISSYDCQNYQEHHVPAAGTDILVATLKTDYKLRILIMLPCMTTNV
jgi:hypothetical protein